MGMHFGGENDPERDDSLDTAVRRKVSGEVESSMSPLSRRVSKLEGVVAGLIESNRKLRRRLKSLERKSG